MKTIPKKQTLKDEELDRELALKHGPAMRDAHKVQVTPKTLKIITNYRDEGFKFTKTNGWGDELSIHAEWNEIKYQRCSLGHDHEIEKKERHWHTVDLAWEHVEQLIEWLQLGSWTEVKGKEPKHRAIYSQTLDLLALIEKTCDVGMIQPQIKKLKAAINEEMRKP